MDRYCYLNAIYRDNSENKYYQFFIVDELFKDISILRTDKDGFDLMMSSDLKKNFKVDNGHLRCNSCRLLTVYPDIEATINKRIRIDKKYKDLYSLLSYGEEHNFVILEDSCETGDVLYGYCYTPFRNVMWSESTMSVYTRMVTESGIYNKMIIMMNESHELEFKVFRFAVPIDESGAFEKKFSMESIGNITINNNEYLMYDSGPMMIYDDSVYVSPCLVNKASVMQSKAKGLDKIFRKLIKELTDIKEVSGKWIGKGNSYKSTFGVYYEADVPRTDSDMVISVVLNSLVKKGIRSKDLLENEYNRNHLNSLEKLYANRIVGIILNSRNQEEIIDGLRLGCECYQRVAFWYGMYLYRVRSLLYYTKKNLCMNYFMCSGSDEPYSTIINEVFNYGDN